MAKKILKKQKLKFYFPTKIRWNPFSYLDRKARKIPKNIIFALLFVFASLWLLRTENKRINRQILGVQTRLQADQKTVFEWEQILSERPDYRDGWIQLAAIYYKLGNREKAKEAIGKAKVLDPTSRTILSFEKLLAD